MFFVIMMSIAVIELIYSMKYFLVIRKPKSYFRVRKVFVSIKFLLAVIVLIFGEQKMTGTLFTISSLLEFRELSKKQSKAK